MTSRYIKTVRFTASETQDIDSKVNKTIFDIVSNGGKVISIRTETFDVSPMKLFFIIIYESDRILPERRCAGNE